MPLPSEEEEEDEDDGRDSDGVGNDAFGALVRLGGR